ncbi:hypothetical protein [Breznakiella homolactica]|uniref:Uncharacterized protein n=1 Tax=Breznakiella homolactica TaxID=2798577 RepID=A0A7T7XPR4_9SPIR|nr:hypothetical protein [Breznakiella homolactica]QQO10197.1 hypothetical protein JFL75_04550 [Breznakiella homolactica]
MDYHNNKTLLELDETVNAYLLFLVHIQQSVNLTIKEKLTAFDEADAVSAEMYAQIQKISSLKVNTFNDEDARKYLEKSVTGISERIKNEMSFYKKKIEINNDRLFYLNDIIDTVSDRTNEIFLGQDKIKKLYSYTELLKDPEEENKIKKIEKQEEEVNQKFNKDFDDIKFKTFQGMIRGVNHKNEDYFYKTNSYVIANYLNKKIGVITSALKHQFNQGVFFILENKNEIEICIKEGGVYINYSIKLKEMEDLLRLFIQGFIQHGDSKIEFYIDETYPGNQINAVLNGYNIKRLIDKYNEIYREYFKEIKEEDLDVKSKKTIDDFLSGKII